MPVSKSQDKKSGTRKSSKSEPVVDPVVDSRDPQGHFSFEFDRIDKNGDGWLSSDELHHGLLSAGWDQDEVCGLFDIIDVNKDGKITKDEFLNYRSGKTGKAMALDPKKVFSDFDEDKDAGLNLREFAALIKDINDKEGFLEDHEVGRYIKAQLAEADTNEDKKVSLEEFLPWYDKFIRHVETVRAEQRGKANANPAPAPPPAVTFDGDGLWKCPLVKVVDALEAAWAKKKTPFLIDSSDKEGSVGSASPLESFLTYGNYELLEMKRMVVEVNMTKAKSLEQAMEEARGKLVNALKYGKVLTVLLANSCPPLTTKFSAPGTLPLAIFDAEQALAVSNIAKWDGLWPAQVIRAGDKVECIRDFKLLVVTKFSVEDYAEFLKDEIPLHLMQPIHVFVP